MRSPWRALHAQLLYEASRLAFQKSFERMRARRTALRPFRDPVALLDALQRPSGDPEAKNDLLAAVIAESQCGLPEAAQTLLLLALWPGLDAVHGRLWRLFPGDRDGLAHEIAAELARQSARLDLSRVSRIAATLVRNVQRDVIRRLRPLRDARLEETPLDDHAHLERAAHDHGGASVLGLQPDLDADEAAARLSARLEAMIGADAGLVIDIAVRGAPQREAIAARGLAFEAGRKRYQRSLARLKKEILA